MAKYVFDASEKIFEIDKDALHFSTASQNGNTSNKECILTVHNISQHYIAFRVKTTKKLEYAVNPTHSVIPPSTKMIINVTLLLKSTSNIDLSSHKFLFEAFVINELDKDTDAKQLFINMTSAQARVKGQEMRLKVVIDGLHGSIVNIGQSQSSLFNSVNMEEIPKQENAAGKEEKEQKEELENLKVEYYKMKNQLGTLAQKYKNLKNRVDMENTPDNANIKPIVLSNVPTETQVSSKIAMGLCLLSVFLGYYLTK